MFSQRKQVIASALLLSATAPLLSQTRADYEKACGATAALMHSAAEPATANIAEIPNGMARVVFIEDFRAARPGHRCLGCGVPVGASVDGSWRAVTKGFSHASFIIAPGVHHLCARIQKDKDEMPAFLQLDAAPGQTYFVVAVPQYEFDYFVERFYVADPDEGGFLASTSKVFAAHD